MTNKCDDLFKIIKNQNTNIGDIRLKSATFNQSKNAVLVSVVTDGVVSLENANYLAKTIEEQLDIGVLVKVELIKSVCDA